MATWQLPSLDELTAHFGAPPHALVASLCDDPARGGVSHVVLHGGCSEADQRVVVAPTLAAFLAWRQLPGGV